MPTYTSIYISYIVLNLCTQPHYCHYCSAPAPAPAAAVPAATTTATGTVAAAAEAEAAAAVAGSFWQRTRNILYTTSQLSSSSSASSSPPSSGYRRRRRRRVHVEDFFLHDGRAMLLLLFP